MEIDDTDGFVIPAFCEIYDILCDEAGDAGLVSSLLNILASQFGVRTFPEPNSPLSSLSESQYALGDISVTYDPGQSDPRNSCPSSHPPSCPFSMTCGAERRVLRASGSEPSTDNSGSLSFFPRIRETRIRAGAT